MKTQHPSSGITYIDEVEQGYLFNELMDSKFSDIIEKKASEKAVTATPNQLMSHLKTTLSKNSGFFGLVMNLRGIYKPGNGKQYAYGYCYDSLKDENGPVEIKILVPARLRQQLTPNSLVLLSGMATQKEDAQRSCVELRFRVDGIVRELQSQVVNADEQKLIGLIQEKNAHGHKPVRSILKNILMKGDRPKVCLVYAQTTITDQDFEKGVKSAGTQIDFFLCKNVSFADTARLVSTLQSYDVKGYDAICLVRGGGGGMEKLDDPRLFECLLGMTTPVIGGLGHVGERHAIYSMVDENVGTPSLLGQYFDNLVKDTAMEREGTISDIASKIEKQYQPHLNRLKELEAITKEDKRLIKELQDQRNRDLEQARENNKEMAELNRKLSRANGRYGYKAQKTIRMWRNIALIAIAVCAFLFYAIVRSGQ